MDFRDRAVECQSLESASKTLATIGALLERQELMLPAQRLYVGFSILPSLNSSP